MGAGVSSMGQELSVSYQAVKTKVHRLMDAVVEGTKTESDVHACIRRWWNLVQPSDRAVARRYLLAVLERSHATLNAISSELPELEGFAANTDRPHDNLAERPMGANASAAAASSLV